MRSVRDCLGRRKRDIPIVRKRKANCVNEKRLVAILDRRSNTGGMGMFGEGNTR